MEKIIEVKVEKLYAFKNHPFHVDLDMELFELMRSIEREGVLVPLIARQNPYGDGYELIAGHRRKAAAERIGIKKVPVVIKEMDDDQSIIEMVDSNLQREHLKPSEKAFAYRMKLEALNRQGKRKKTTSCQLGTNLNPTVEVQSLEIRQTEMGYQLVNQDQENYVRKTSGDELAKQAGESRRQIYRFVRLTRALPAYSGAGRAPAAVMEIIERCVPVDIGFTKEGWFVLRIPLLLPKKESGSSEYIRSVIYPEMRDFFRDREPVRFHDCVLVYRHVYDRERPERRARDHDNIETNMVSDIIAMYVLPDDSPRFCSHYECSAAGSTERTEVYVIPESEFVEWFIQKKKVGGGENSVWCEGKKRRKTGIRMSQNSLWKMIPEKSREDVAYLRDIPVWDRTGFRQRGQSRCRILSFRQGTGAVIHFNRGSHVHQLVTILSFTGEYPSHSLFLLGNRQVMRRLVRRLISPQTFRNDATGEEHTCRLPMSIIWVLSGSISFRGTARTGRGITGLLRRLLSV